MKSTFLALVSARLRIAVIRVALILNFTRKNPCSAPAFCSVARLEQRGTFPAAGSLEMEEALVEVLEGGEFWEPLGAWERPWGPWGRPWGLR
jgi:hypothetical protein